MIRLTVVCYLLICCVLPARAQERSAVQKPVYVNQPEVLKVHTDFITLNNDNKLFQDVYYKSDLSFTGTFTLTCYRYNTDNDSFIVFKKTELNQFFKSGVRTIKLDYSKNDNYTYFFPKFYEIVKKTEVIPPGSYKIYISVTGDSIHYATTILRNIDSTLALTSALRKDINKALSPPDRSFMGIHLSGITRSNASLANATKAMDRSKGRLNKVYSAKGLTPVVFGRDGKKCTDLYYEQWFVGRYEIRENENVTRQIDAQKSALTKGIIPSTPTNTTNPQSLLSQVKELNKAKKDEKETTGEIGITTAVSNGQEQYSQTDNNYMELHGKIATSVMNVPIVIEGMYTTQDAHRTVKASYVNVHYDIEKSKAELTNSVNSYNRQFSEQSAKLKNGDQFYQAGISNLNSQKGKLESEIKNETGITNPTTLAKMDTAYLRQKIDSNVRSKADSGATNATQSNAAGSADSTRKAAMNREQQLKDSTDRVYKRVMAKYQKIEKLEAQLLKYKMLMTQNKNTTYFDSVLAYNKTKELGSKDPSYKQMAQQSEKILPDGQAKKFITGLTSFDAGIFPQYASKYTMSGQTVKGLNMGYDFGFVEAGLTVGKTEYIGRDGNLDKYTCYSGRASFKPLKGHKASLIYYGYTPSRQMLSDQFFKNSDIALPTFQQPQHIVSLTYEGIVTKDVKFNAEAATCFGQQLQTGTAVNGTSGGDRSAYTFSTTGKIPNSSAELEAAYEKTGINFQNNTLPVSTNGTEKLTIAWKEDFFHSFLAAGVEYDYLLQSNFATTGANTKWGFDLKTKSKKYPSLSVSYKPFTTFRSNSDTFSIPQHPLLGSVFTGKASYQIKRPGRSIRFTFIYNKSVSHQDTVNYGTTLLQLNCTYTRGKWMLGANIGSTQVNGTTLDTTGPQPPNKTKFLSLTGSYAFTKQFNVNAGQEFGIANFGFCRYAFTGGCMYTSKRLPLTTRINLRYNTYQSVQYGAWSNLYSGTLDLLWQIKKKQVIDNTRQKK